MGISTFRTLPLYESAEVIRSEIAKGKNLLLTAPTGSGKSTLIPWLLADGKENSEATKSKIVVLEPRRLAATSLSGFLAQLTETPEGTTVGYKIRFESKLSDKTKILSTTSGSFLQSVLHRTKNSTGSSLTNFTKGARKWTYYSPIFWHCKKQSRS